VKRRVLIQVIREAADQRNVPCRLSRQGRRHEFWEVGDFLFAIPRHREINEWTAEGIMRDLEPILGENWWRA
jgi:hypothetical protein